MTQTPIGVTVYGEHNLVEGNSIHDDSEPIKPLWGPMGIVVWRLATSRWPGIAW